MGFHARLGAASLLFTLEEGLLERIVSMLFVRPELVNECFV